MEEMFFSHEATSTLWLVLFGLLIWRTLFFSKFIGGIGLCHWFQIAINHIISEVMSSQAIGYANPDRLAATNGYRLTAWAALGLIFAFFTILIFERKETLGGKISKIGFELEYGIGIFIYGLICYFILSGLLGFISSITSILSAGLGVACGGFAWCYLIIYKAKGPLVSLIFASGMFLFPVLTLILGGFMGFGISAIFGIAGIVFVNFRPRWVIGIIIPILLFFGLSLYPSYMSTRDDIRSSVWGGGRIEERIEATFGGIFEKWQWFDPSDEKQLDVFNGRLNQNVLLGYSQTYLAAGQVEYAGGQTLWDGVLSLIPRIIWTNKPFQAGSYGLVTQYTGIKVSEGTSVGIGFIMEFYVNFGYIGILVGFYLLGLCVYLFDYKVGQGIQAMNFPVFIYYFIAGQCFMNILGSFVVVGPALVGGLILTWIYLRIFQNRLQVKKWVDSSNISANGFVVSKKQSLFS